MTLHKLRCFICMCLYVFFSGTSIADNADESRSGFETPPSLRKDVRFWERVFDEYSSDQCVFHDEWNLDVVYYVSAVPRVSRSAGGSKLRRHLLAIRTALRSIAQRGRPAGEFEERIYNAVPEAKRNRSFFEDAQNQVRCQRGVDFGPALERGAKLVPMIKRILRSKGLPEDLAYLPYLESGFNRLATSKVGAKGLWQFMPGTAREEGLKVRRGDDWRTDVSRSTDAATDYLAAIYLRTRSWPLAITAYNYGQNGVMRAIQKFGSDYLMIRSEHRTKLFGFAARNYYPSFLASRNVAQKYEGRVSGVEFDTPAIAEGYEVRDTKAF